MTRPAAALKAPAPPSSRLVAIDAEAILHDIQRALLDLFVDPPDVLAEDADGDHLHAAEEQDAEDRRGESAAGLLVLGEEGDEVEDRQSEGDGRDEEPHPRHPAQRAIAEAEDRIHGIVDELSQRLLRLAGRALGAIVDHAR